MKENYVQLGREDKTKWLLSTYPNAFLLLTLVAILARRWPDHPDGLMIGDAIINAKNCGLSRQEYRTAIEKLVEFGMIKIIHNGKKFIEPRKSTINLTITSMVVNLIDSVVYDINPQPINQPTNQLATNEQPTSNHKQERIRKKKNEEEEKEKIKKENPTAPEKKHFREFVTLTQEQHDSLLSRHGVSTFASMLDILNSYKGRSGKEYKCDYSAMDSGSWVVKEATKDKRNETPQKPALNGVHAPEGEPRFKGRVVSVAVKGDSGNGN